MTERVVCYGELLLRLAAPGREPLLDSRRFEVHVGGAEANVAVSLARLGHRVDQVGTVAANALGDAALGELRRHGVGTDLIRRENGRMGLYFLATGAMQRPSEVLYDRADSAFARCPQPSRPWPEILEGADVLHVSGVTPALGPACADAVLAAMQAARAQKVFTVFDGNYRARLWHGREAQAPAIIRGLMAEADLILGDQRDIAVALGWSPPEGDPAQQFAAAAQLAFETFPNLGMLASTIRLQRSVDHHSLSAILVRRDAEPLRAGPFELNGIVDRIGAGDAFAAGLLHALRNGDDEATCLRFALAAACLKHSLPGDFNLVDRATITHLVEEGRFDVRR